MSMPTFSPTFGPTRLLIPRGVHRWAYRYGVVTYESGLPMRTEWHPLEEGPWREGYELGYRDAQAGQLRRAPAAAKGR